MQTAAPFFQVVHAWLPLTYAVEGFRTLIAGGSADLVPGVLVIVAWLVGGLAPATLGAWRAGRPGATPELDAGRMVEA